LSNHKPNSPKWRNYAAQVERLILNAQILAGLPVLEPDEIEARAEIWTEFLIELVPLDSLYEAFKQAVSDHTGNFAVNFTEVKSAYLKIQQEAQYEQIKEYQANNRDDDYECKFCFNSGFCSVDAEGFSIPLIVRGRYGVRKCNAVGCDYWFRRLAKAGLVKGYSNDEVRF
jgi:hypothetical protein